jgi:hypothetical protein
MKLKAFNLLGQCMIIAVLTGAQPLSAQATGAPAGNEAFRLNRFAAGNSMQLHISLESDESGHGRTGMIKILDASGNKVQQSTIELVAAPLYSTIELKNLAKGNYSVILITDKKVYDSKLDLN